MASALNNLKRVDMPLNKQTKPIICLHTFKWSNSLISNNSVKQKSFVCTQFKCQTVLFDPKIGSYQVLQLVARVDPGAMAMKRFSTFPKAPALLQPHYQIVLCHIRILVEGSFFFTSPQRYSRCILQRPLPAYWARRKWNRWHKFKSKTKFLAFNFALKHMRKGRNRLLPFP